MTITTLDAAPGIAADMATLIIVGSCETRLIAREGQTPLVYTPRAVEGALA
jgi:precorrin-3B C17-methyltransferase